jgi:4-hydroxy-tetrahydrodipicolinate reductase
MTRIGLFGAAGHMGKVLIRAVLENSHLVLAAGCDRPGSKDIGTDLGTLAGMPANGVALTSYPGELCRVSDVVVDYSAAAATMILLPVALETKTPLLVCTTGFSEAQHTALTEAGRTIPIMVGANMARSVVAMYELVRTAARLLGDEFDIEIFDFHPANKIDAPSGTALELAAFAAEGRGVALADAIVTARHGETETRRRGSIGFSSARGGDEPCENTVFFAGDGQRLEITSRVTDQSAFAPATLQAAAWLAGRQPGFYELEDMLQT